MINLEQRIKNKAFWISIISLVVLLLQQLGLVQLVDYIPKNYVDIINTIFAILSALGIVVDTSTPGLADNVIGSESVQAINGDGKITTPPSNTVSQNSASSKIVVDNPNNTVSIGQEVAATSASKPQ